MTDEQRQPVSDAAEGVDAPVGQTVERIQDAAPIAVEDMIPEPASDPEPVEETGFVAEPESAPDGPTEPAEAAAEPPAEPAAAVSASEPPAEPIDAAEVAATTESATEPTAEPAAEVAPLTAADIPALEGCDVEKSWSGDDTCEGTEAITETPEQAEAVIASNPEADSGLEPAEGEAEAAQLVGVEQPAIHTTPTWPFIAYLVVWALLCVAAGYALLQIPSGQAVALTEPYRIAVLGGVAMTIAGPLLILAVWLTSMIRAGEQGRTGMLASSLLKGSVVTFLGVIMWWGTFLIVDQVRFGRFF